MKPTLKLAYLVALAVGLFLLRDPWLLGGLALLQLVLWASSRLDFRMLGRLARRMTVFLVILTVTYAFFSAGSRAEDRWVELAFGLEINLAGLALALEMGLRVATLILASTWVQNSGQPSDFVRALTTFRLPRAVAYSIDGTLAMLSGGGGGGGGGRRGGGGGGGGGRGRDRTTDRPVIDFAAIRRGDLSFIRELLRRSIDRAEERVAREHPEASRAWARDLALVSGVSLAAMGLKMLQVMPGLPVAPGHKNVLLIPFFLLAAKHTRTRFGGLWTGTTIGLISFFLGYGRYGILEVLHFVVPGLLADLLVPFLHGRGLWRLIQLMGMGAVLGAARFAANFSVIVLAGAKLEMFVVYAPMLVSQVVFGTLSGFVSMFLLGSDDWLAYTPAAESGKLAKPESGAPESRSTPDVPEPSPEPLV